MSQSQPSPVTPIGGTVDRSVAAAMMCGARQRCPACGKGRLFRAFLKVNEACPVCAEALHHQRADDAPAYFTMVVVAHVVVGGILVLEKAMAPATWVQLVIWLPLTAILSLALLPRIKGMLVGLQWALRMHGFGGSSDAAEPDPAATTQAGAQAGVKRRP